MTGAVEDTTIGLLYEKAIGKFILQRDAGDAEIGNLKNWDLPEIQTVALWPVRKKMVRN